MNHPENAFLACMSFSVALLIAAFVALIVHSTGNPPDIVAIAAQTHKIQTIASSILSL